MKIFKKIVNLISTISLIVLLVLAFVAFDRDNYKLAYRRLATVSICLLLSIERNVAKQTALMTEEDDGELY